MVCYLGEFSVSFFLFGKLATILPIDTDTDLVHSFIHINLKAEMENKEKGVNKVAD